MANEFVVRSGIISLGSISLPYLSTPISYTATTDDFFIDAVSTGITITLPSATGIVGKHYVIKNSSSTQIEVNTYLSQLIDGQTSQLIGTNDIIQVVSRGNNWRITQATGVISGATNNALITSDGSVSGMDSRRGLSFDGKTLKLTGQTSGNTYIQSFAYSLSGITASNQSNSNTVFSISRDKLVSLDVDYRVVRTTGNLRVGTFRRYNTDIGDSRPNSATVFSGVCNTDIFPTATTTNINFFARTTNSTPDIVGRVDISVRATKLI